MIAKTELAKTAADVLESYPIAGALIGPGMPVTREWLASRFQLFIRVEEEAIANEEQAAPAASKLFGRPFLDPGVDWPAGYYFYAQLEMREVSPFDFGGVLPERGTLYLFFDPTASDFRPRSPTAAKAVFVADESAARELRDLPAKAMLPKGGQHYYKDFVRTSYRLTFETVFSFGNLETLPEGLIETMTKRLGIRCVPAPAFGTVTTMFGEPVTQDGDGEAGLFAPPGWDWSEGEPPTDPDRVLLLQRDFFDSQLHFWARRDAIRTGDFSSLEVTTSG